MHTYADERMTSADAAAALGIQGESRLKQKVECGLRLNRHHKVQI